MYQDILFLFLFLISRVIFAEEKCHNIIVGSTKNMYSIVTASPNGYVLLINQATHLEHQQKLSLYRVPGSQNEYVMMFSDIDANLTVVSAFLPGADQHMQLRMVQALPLTEKLEGNSSHWYLHWFNEYDFSIRQQWGGSTYAICSVRLESLMHVLGVSEMVSDYLSIAKNSLQVFSAADQKSHELCTCLDLYEASGVWDLGMALDN